MEGAGERAVPSVTQRGWKERPSGLGRAAPLLRVSPAPSGKSGGLSQVLPGVASSSTVLFFSVRTPLLMNRFLLFLKTGLPERRGWGNPVLFGAEVARKLMRKRRAGAHARRGEVGAGPRVEEASSSGSGAPSPELWLCAES